MIHDALLPLSFPAIQRKKVLVHLGKSEPIDEFGGLARYFFHARACANAVRNEAPFRGRPRPNEKWCLRMR